MCNHLLTALCRAESIRTGFLLSQGGEFAFVLLSLACQLKLLPNDLNQILIITVVCSMALTPALAQAGQLLGDFVEAQAAGGSSSSQVAAQGGADLAEVSGWACGDRMRGGNKGPAVDVDGSSSRRSSSGCTASSAVQCGHTRSRVRAQCKCWQGMPSAAGLSTMNFDWSTCT